MIKHLYDCIPVRGVYDIIVAYAQELKGHCARVIQTRAAVWALVALPHGKFAFSSGHNICVRDHTERIVTLKGHTRPVVSLAVLPNGLLVSGSRDGTLRWWDVTSGMCTYQSVSYDGHRTFSMRALAVLSDGTLAVGNHRIDLYANGVRIYEMPAIHRTIISSLAALPNNLLASAAENVCISDMTAKVCLHTLKHTHQINALSLVFNGQLASGSNDSAVRVWDVATGECVRIIHIGPREDGAYNHVAQSLVLLPDGQLVVSVARCPTKVFNPHTGELVRSMVGHTEGIYAMATMPDGKLLTGSSDLTVRVWE